MNIHNKSSLIDFYTKHPASKKVLTAWYNDVLNKVWLKPSDIVNDFNSARTIKNNRAIFKINGNDYRLITEQNYDKSWVFIKFIGTHAEYDKIDAETINMYDKKKNNN
jgi:mRNA interferase HigB